MPVVEKGVKGSKKVNVEQPPTKGSTKVEPAPTPQPKGPVLLKGPPKLAAQPENDSQVVQAMNELLKHNWDEYLLFPDPSCLL